MFQRAKNIQEEVTFLRERISFLKNIIMAITKVNFDLNRNQKHLRHRQGCSNLNSSQMNQRLFRSGSPQLKAGGGSEGKGERVGKRAKVEARFEEKFDPSQRSRHARRFRFLLQKLNLRFRI